MLIVDISLIVQHDLESASSRVVVESCDIRVGAGLFCDYGRPVEILIAVDIGGEELIGDGEGVGVLIFEDGLELNRY